MLVPYFLSYLDKHFFPGGVVVFACIICPVHSKFLLNYMMMINIYQIYTTLPGSLLDKISYILSSAASERKVHD